MMMPSILLLACFASAPDKPPAQWTAEERVAQRFDAEDMRRRRERVRATGEKVSDDENIVFGAPPDAKRLLALERGCDHPSG